MLARKLFLGMLLFSLFTILLISKVNEYFSHRAFRQRNDLVASLKQSLKADVGQNGSKAQVVKWLKKNRIPYKYQVGKQHPTGDVILGTVPLPHRFIEDYSAIDLAFSFGKNGNVVKQGINWSSSGL
ncbi:hypothetical protein EON80_11005 [bacterium]|nr:MAG: hypothetical protein EON80_11005 [bacterium]